MGEGFLLSCRANERENRDVLAGWHTHTHTHILRHTEREENTKKK